MALSNGPAGGLNSGPLIYLSARSQDANGNKIAPHFEIARKGEDGKITKTDETCTKVSGSLQRPRFSVREHKGIPSKHVTFYIRDNDANETYHLDCTYRISTRQLFNGVISLETPDDISINIWETRKGYEALSLRQGDKLVPWKYDSRKGEIPEPEKVKFKGKDMSDYTAVDDFFEAELKEWADRVFGPERTTSGAQDTGDAQGDTAQQEAPAPARQAAPATQARPAARANPVPAAAKTTTQASAPKPAAAPTAQRPAARPAPKQTPPPQSEPAKQENLDEDVPF